jgi:hypothetical protein
MHPVVRHHEKPVAQGPRILGAGSIALISLAAVLTEIHGIEVQSDGSYRLPCLQD